MKNPRVAPWLIDESEYWELEDAKAQKEFLLRYAVLAPSSHNTQPWSFRLTADGIEVFADYSRSLPVADPSNRELLLSVGAAITNLRVAAAHFGWESVVLYQDREESHLPLALVTLRETCNPDASLRSLFPAITKRHTNRGEYEPREVEPSALATLCDFADEFASNVRFIVPHDRPRVAELVEQADELLMSDQAWRRELAEWVRPNESNAEDGMSADAFGIPGPMSALAPWIIRSFDVGESRGHRDRELVEHSAGVVVITGDDDRTSLVRAGEVMERLLLLLTSLDIQYAFVNQPMEVPPLRREVWSLIRSPRPPQLLVRFGYARAVTRAMPRRSPPVMA